MPDLREVEPCLQVCPGPSYPKFWGCPEMGHSKFGYTIDDKQMEDDRK